MRYQRYDIHFESISQTMHTIYIQSHATQQYKPSLAETLPPDPPSPHPNSNPSRTLTLQLPSIRYLLPLGLHGPLLPTANLRPLLSPHHRPCLGRPELHPRLPRLPLQPPRDILRRSSLFDRSHRQPPPDPPPHKPQRSQQGRSRQDLLLGLPGPRVLLL